MIPIILGTHTGSTFDGFTHNRLTTLPIWGRHSIHAILITNQHKIENRSTQDSKFIAQKKNRKKLIGQIKKCETIHKRVKDNPNYHIQPSEQKKLNELSSYRRELEELNALIDPVKVQKGNFRTWKLNLMVQSWNVSCFVS